MTAPHRAAAAIVVGMLLSGLAACAAETPRPTPTPSRSTTPSAATTPTPTPQALLVGGGDRPPTVLDGECGALVTTAVLTDAVGSQVDVLERRDPRWTIEEDNLGALTCDFTGPTVGGRVIVYAAEAFDGTGLAFDAVPMETGACVNACEWKYRDDDVLAIGYVYPRDYGEEEAIRVGAVLGPLVADAVRRADDAPWRRDTSGWWPVRDCEEVAAAISAVGGATLAGVAGEEYTGDIDPETQPAWLAANRSACLLGDPADGTPNDVEVVFTSGTAWAVGGTSSAAVDVGVPGVTVYEWTPPAAAAYAMTDGINSVSVSFLGTPPVDALSLVTAIARTIAPG